MFPLFVPAIVFTSLTAATMLVLSSVVRSDRDPICEARKSPSVANMYLFNDYKSKLKKYYDESVNDLETGYYTYDEYKKRENDIKGSINYIQELNDDPDVFVALANYGTAFESTYPDTWFLRNILITEGRCPNDKTLPKMKWWEKIKFLYKLKKEAKKD